MFKYTLDELKTLASEEMIHDFDKELIPTLRTYWVDLHNIYASDLENLFHKPTIGLCACLGPRDGYPECPCRMRRLVYAYRYHIAIQLVEDPSLLATDPEKIRKATEERDNLKLCMKRLFDIKQSKKAAPKVYDEADDYFERKGAKPL